MDINDQINSIMKTVNCKVDNTIEEFVVNTVNNELSEMNITVNAKKIAECIKKSEENKLTSEEFNFVYDALSCYLRFAHGFVDTETYEKYMKMVDTIRHKLLD